MPAFGVGVGQREAEESRRQQQSSKTAGTEGIGDLVWTCQPQLCHADPCLFPLTPSSVCSSCH